MKIKPINFAERYKENKEKRKAVFMGVSNDDRKGNLAYSNFIYSLCYYCIKEKDNVFNSDDFVRHDMRVFDNYKESVFNTIFVNDTIVFLADELPIINDDNSSITEVYNPNVWFELGLAATQKDKTIILISQNPKLPFYANNVQSVPVGMDMLELYLNNNIQIFKKNIPIENREEVYINFWQDIFSKDDTSSARNQLNLFRRIFTEKLNAAKNPFQYEIQIQGDFVNLVTFGEADIYQLLKKSDQDPQAKFIKGEKNAFEALINAVDSIAKEDDKEPNHKKSEIKKHVLRTTRFANQSIVTKEESDVDDVRNKFMIALYDASKRNVESHRIICNNNIEKWKDIYSYLFNCAGNTTISVAKAAGRKIYHEMVIVDSNIVFIHFYLTADKSDTSVQRISSTLQITSENVAEEFIKIYENSESDKETIFATFKVSDINVVDSDKEKIIMQKFIEVAKQKLHELNDDGDSSDRDYEDGELEDVVNMIAGMCVIKDFDEVRYLEQFYMRNSILVKSDYIRNQIEEKIKANKKVEVAISKQDVFDLTNFYHMEDFNG